MFCQGSQGPTYLILLLSVFVCIADISDRPFEQLSQGSKKKSESVKDTSGV